MKCIPANFRSTELLWRQNVSLLQRTLIDIDDYRESWTTYEVHKTILIGHKMEETFTFYSYLQQ